MSSSMFSNSLYKDFIKNHKAKDNEICTHTRIGDVENHKVYPGKYHIPQEDLPEFYKLYEEHVFVKNNNEYLTEKQMERILYCVWILTFDTKRQCNVVNIVLSIFRI